VSGIEPSQLTSLDSAHQRRWASVETLAIGSQLLHFVMAILALYFCVTLFLRQHAYGWLLLGAGFLEPFVLLLMRAVRGRSLLAYKTVSSSADGIMQVS
jgi:hypothetical protein